MSTATIDPQLFQKLQAKIDQDVKLRENLKGIMQDWERQQRTTTSILTKIHSNVNEKLSIVLSEAGGSLEPQKQSMRDVAQAISGSPYWKFNGTWSREVQQLCLAYLLIAWLAEGELKSLEAFGAAFDVPVNLKDEDAFHVTIEEYLHAVVTLTEELARLAVNAVTLGDFQRPIQISKFVKELHAGFQLLNLKNDSLRRRVDSVKYQVKKIEDVVYDLSLRNLIPRDPESSGGPIKAGS